MRLSALLCFTLMAISHAAEPVVVAPVLDLKQAIQVLNDDNFEMAFTPAGILANGELNLTIASYRKRWSEGSGVSPKFCGGAHTVKAVDLVFDGSRITGSMIATIRPDAWVPTDKKPHDLPFTVDLIVEKGSTWSLFGTWKGPVLNPDGSLREVTEGTVSGIVQVPKTFPPPGCFSLGTWKEGLALEFDLGRQRVGWANYRWSRFTFPANQDWSSTDGLRVTVRMDKPRSDVRLSVWLREDQGGWFYLSGAIPLHGQDNQGIAWFEDFTEAEFVAPANARESWIDADFMLDRRNIRELALGVIDPMGAGIVALTVTGLDLVRQPERIDRHLVKAAVEVSGKTLAVNDHDLVPVGLFGGFDPELPARYRPGCQRILHTVPGGTPSPARQGEAFIIDCWGDQTQAADLIKNPKGWRTQLAALATEYATKAKEEPGRHVLEFWNEPYLDWGRRRYHQNPSTYDLSRAREGGKVFLKEAGPEGTDLEIPYFTWKRNAKGLWEIIDTSQFTYWSGRANGFIYNQMAEVVARSIKAVDPNLPVLVGWGFRWNEDHWAAWDMLFKPTLDVVGALVDGIHEHHYMGDTRVIPALYEFITAYGQVCHGKWYHGYNTETNALFDQPATGYIDTPEKDNAAVPWHRLVYNFRDLMALLSQVPDKARSRTVTHHHQTPEALAVVYGLLADLRGRLLVTASDDPEVWVAASIDGTDPAAMPADAMTRMVVVLWNDHRLPADVQLTIRPPTGSIFTTATIDSLLVDPVTFRLDLQREGEVPVANQVFSRTIHLSPRSPCRILLPIPGARPGPAEVVRRQFFAPAFLTNVTRTTPLQTIITLPVERLAVARQASLRCVVERVADGSATVTVGSSTLRLPRMMTNEEVCRIVELPVPIKDLAQQTAISFQVTADNQPSYRVVMASLMLEEAKP